MKKLCCNSYDIHIFGQDSHVIWASISQIHHFLPSSDRIEMHELRLWLKFILFLCLFIRARQKYLIGSHDLHKLFCSLFGVYFGSRNAGNSSKNHVQKGLDKALISSVAVDGNSTVSNMKETIIQKSNEKEMRKYKEWSLMKIQIL